MTPEALFNEQRPDVLFEEGGAVLLRRKRHGRKQKRTDVPGQHQRILSMLMVPRDSGAVDKQGRRCRPASRSPGSAQVHLCGALSSARLTRKQSTAVSSRVARERTRR